jgi:hypothetical protein
MCCEGLSQATTASHTAADNGRLCTHRSRNTRTRDAGVVKHVARCTRLPGGKKQRPAGGRRMHAESQCQAQEAGRRLRPALHSCTWQEECGRPVGMQAEPPHETHIRKQSTHITPPFTQPPPTHGARHKRLPHTALKYLGRLASVPTTVCETKRPSRKGSLPGKHTRTGGHNAHSKLSGLHCAAPRVSGAVNNPQPVWQQHWADCQPAVGDGCAAHTALGQKPTCRPDCQCRTSSFP